MPFAEAIDKLGSLSPIGAALSSSEWADLPVELRENAFFSANVESVRFLQTMQDSIGDYLAGNVKTLDDGQTLLATGGRAAFVDQMQKRLSAMGVGRGDGGIRDITSEARLKLIFDIKTQQAGDYGYWRQGMDPDVLNEFPAMRFIRVKSVKEPRLAHEGYEDQVFLKTDPIWWHVINKDFGVPWGPWGWGCGHDVEDVDREEAESLHLIRPGEQLALPATMKKFLNLNGTLQASANGIAPELLAKMKSAFGDQIVIRDGMIQWRAQSEATPAAAPVATVRSAPVSDALELRVGGTLKTQVTAALQAIDEVHDDGTLPTIPVKSSRQASFGFLEMARGADGLEATEIGVRSSGKWPALTLVHEAGHFLDLAAIGTKGQLASVAGDADMMVVIDAARQSDSVKNLAQRLADTHSMELRRAYRYYLKPEELWARAYAQFITEKSGSQLLQNQLQSAIDADKDRQWSTEDFKPISAAIEALFTKLNWL